MRTTLTLLLLTLATFSGMPQPSQKPIEIENTDSIKYFKAALKGDKLVYLLIDAKKKCDAENKILIAENEILLAVNEKLKLQKIIIIHDTIYKKRKFLQLF